MLKWEEAYGQWKLVEFDKDMPKGNLVWATITQGRVCMMAEFEMTFVDEMKPSKNFNFSGILSYLSSRISMWRKRRALNKAQKWCEKQYQNYWKVMGVDK